MAKHKDKELHLPAWAWALIWIGVTVALFAGAIAIGSFLGVM
jgi:hypothetical protein